MNGLYIDVAFGALVLISSAMAFLRGFAREFLGALAVVAAGLGTLWGFESPLKTAVEEALTSNDVVDPWVAHLILIVGVFLIIYIAVTIVTSSISSVMHRSNSVGFIDRILGLAFGAARGIVIAGLAFIAVYAFWPQEDRPEALAQAQTCPAMKLTAEQIQKIAPPESAIVVDPRAEVAEGEARPALTFTCSAPATTQAGSDAEATPTPDDT